MLEAIQLAKLGMDNGEGGPFGCVIVRDNKIVGHGHNQVTSTNDPTAHAEIVAIRQACRNLNTFQLTGCQIYTSCEPCPMCLGAIYWARPDRVYYACTREDAAKIDFDDDFIYEEIIRPLGERQIPMIPLLHDEGLVIFLEWKMKPDKRHY